MTGLKPILITGCMLCGVAVSGCTSTGTQPTPTLAATAEVAYPALPEAIMTVPSAYNGDDVSGGGSIAEAAVLVPATQLTVAVAAPAVVTQPDQTAIAQAQPAPVAEAQVASAGAGQIVLPPPAAPGSATPVETADTSARGGAVAALDAATHNEALAGVATASFAGATPNQPAVPQQVAALEPPAVAAHPDAILAPEGRLGAGAVEARSPELDNLIVRYANYYKVPVELIRRTVKRESTFNPKARNGPYWGLMQIRHDTAKGMGYRGTAAGLLDAETNLKYAVRYLRGAFLVAKGDHALADRLYQRGYYYDAKRAGLLDETGLGKDRRRRQPSS